MAATGRPIGLPLTRRLVPGSGGVFEAAFSPDGRTVLTASSRKVTLWDATRGTRLDEWSRQARFAGAAVFNPDSKFVVFANGKDAVFWEVPQPLRGDPERILLWVQQLTELDLDESDNARPLKGPALERVRGRLRELGGPPKG